MRCPHCSASNEDDARYCGGCGGELTSARNLRRPTRQTTRRQPTRPTPLVGAADAASPTAAVLPVPTAAPGPATLSAPTPATATLSARAPDQAEEEEERKEKKKEGEKEKGEKEEGKKEKEAPAALALYAEDPGTDVPSEALVGPSGMRHLAEEPAGGLQLLLLLTGIALIGLFCAPWRLAGAGTFSWEILPRLDALTFARRIYLVVGGVLCTATALLPLPRRLRAAMGLVLGLLPLALQQPASLALRELSLAVVLVLLPAALLWRARASASLSARVGTALGAATIAALLLVPQAGSLPLLAGLAAEPTASFALVLRRLLPFALLVLAALSLLAFLPRTSSGGVQIWATLLLLYIPARAWLQAAALLSTGSAELAGFHEGLVTLLAGACAALGLAHLLPRPHEAR